METMQQTQTNTSDIQTTATQTITTDGGFLDTFLTGTTATDSSLNAAFDVRAFRSHPCFSAVGEEQNYCLGLFGVTSDFESMLEGNQIGKLIVEHALKMRCENLTAEEHAACMERNAAILPQLISQVNIQVSTGSVAGSTPTTVDMEDTDEEEFQTVTMSRHTRGQRLWELCKDHEETQAGCYQSFLRFVTDENITEDEMIKVLGVQAARKDEEGMDQGQN